MHHDATRKIHHTHLAKQSVGMPCAMCQRTIDKQTKQYHKHHIGGKTNTLGKRAGDERGCDDGKLHLKQRKQSQRDCRCKIIVHLCAYTLKHKESCGVAYHAAYVVTKRQAEANHYPQHANDTHSNKTLQDGGNHIFLPYHTSIEK